MTRVRPWRDDSSGRRKVLSRSSTSSGEVAERSLDPSNREKVYGPTPLIPEHRRLTQETLSQIIPAVLDARRRGLCWLAIAAEVGIKPTQAEYVFRKYIQKSKGST